MGIKSDQLAVKAKALGGARTMDFSQGADLVFGDTSGPDQGKLYKKVMKKDGTPMGGVCATFSAFWIVFHAMQDAGKPNPFTRGRSVWDYLFTDGGINLGAAQNIVIEHHRTYGNQRNVLEAFMAKFGITKRTKSLTTALPLKVVKPLTHSVAIDCANLIGKVGGYKVVELKPNTNGSGSGHEVCAWSDGGDVVFMDPNYGEYWLPDGVSFGEWFQYFVQTTYGTKYKAIIVHNYAAGG